MLYDDYFRAINHIKCEIPKTFTWKGIDSTGLAEVMEEAEKHGYDYKLISYEEQFIIKGELITHHTRAMTFTPKNREEK